MSESSNQPSSQPPCILFCNCTYAKVVPEEVKAQVLENLAASGVAFEAVPDLCEMAASKDPALKRLAASGPVKVAACYPRAVKWLFSQSGAPLPEGSDVLNMRIDDPELITEELLKPVIEEPSA